MMEKQERSVSRPGRVDPKDAPAKQIDNSANIGMHTPEPTMADSPKQAVRPCEDCPLGQTEQPADEVDELEVTADLEAPLDVPEEANAGEAPVADEAEQPDAAPIPAAHEGQPPAEELAVRDAAPEAETVEDEPPPDAALEQAQPETVAGSIDRQGTEPDLPTETEEEATTSAEEVHTEGGEEVHVVPGKEAAEQASRDLLCTTIEEFSSSLLDAISHDHLRFTHIGALRDFLQELRESCKEMRVSWYGGSEEEDVVPYTLYTEMLKQPLDRIRRTYPSFAYAELVPDLVEDFAQIQEDLSDFASHKDLFNHWKSKAEQFAERLPELASKCQEISDTCWPKTFPEWISSEESGLLNGRARGLEIILGRIQELPDKIGSWLEDTGPAPDPGQLKRAEDVAAELKDADPTEHAAIRRKAGDWNFRQVRTMNDLAQKSRTSFFEFLQNHVFEIVNFLDEGKLNSQELKETLLNSHKDNEQDVEGWFGIYDRMIERMENLLLDFDIESILATRGQVADFNVHEPFMTEQAPEMETGQVYGMVFRGYQLTGSDAQIIQRAKVTVVRN